MGVKVPPLFLPALLLSYSFSETKVLEFDVAYENSSPISTLGLGVTGKVFLATEEVGSLSIIPVLGAGVRLTLLSFRVLGQTLPVTVMSVNWLVGSEYRILDSPDSVFAEIRNSFSLDTFGMGIGVAVGVRIEF